MTISVALRADNAIMISDRDDPRAGLVIDNLSEADELIAALAAAVARVRVEQAQMPVRMRAVAQAVTDEDPCRSVSPPSTK